MAYTLPDSPTLYMYITVPFFLISVFGRALLPHPTALLTLYSTFQYSFMLMKYGYNNFHLLFRVL